MAQTAEQKRAWYLANREQYLVKRRAQHVVKRDGIRRFVTEYLQEHPCVDCGETDPIVLDFDHVGEKSFGISSAIANLVALPKIRAEIEQCEVRCANCHRRKTYRTLGYRSRGVNDD
jgi:5-methylcytosine-specific restriction endonuclease McrA